MTGSTRWFVLVAVAALLVVVGLQASPQQAVAQRTPEFPPGEWAGGMWFNHEVSDGNSGVQHVGSGGFKVRSTTTANDSAIPLDGTISFAVLVRGFTDIAKTARVYEADWPIIGFGDVIDLGGSVSVSGVDSALFEETGNFVPVGLDFETEGTGTLVVQASSCAGVNGTFSTGLISPPGGIQGVAFIAPFTAMPSGTDDVDAQWEIVVELVGELWELTAGGSEVPLGGDELGNSGVLQLVRALEREIGILNQLVADSGVCGGATGKYAPAGVIHELLARRVLNLLDIVSQTNDGFTTQELIDLLSLGASMGAFSPDAQFRPQEIIDRVLHNYPIALEHRLAAAKESDDDKTREAIHTVACQWGWDELKTESQP